MHVPSKQESWAKRSDEISIPIKPDFDYQFTRRWFRNRNLTTFSTFLSRRFDGTKPVKMIQIGVFEGMDLVWQFQNTLAHKDSYCIAIDPWAATTKLDAEHMEGVYKRATRNLRRFRSKLHIIRGTSQDVLPPYIDRMPGVFDLVVIDGDHNAPAVLKDAELAAQLVKPGGWLLFDDYHNDRAKEHHVKEAVDRFLKEEAGMQLVWFHRYCVCVEKVV